MTLSHACTRGRAARRRRAFTLVELLVVITIIGILMALLAPATQSVRESMRRTSCKNNLRQFGIAAQGHCEKYGYYPSSGWGFKWIGEPNWGFGKKQPGGWVYNCLPFMGLSVIHEHGSRPDPSSGLTSWPMGTSGEGPGPNEERKKLLGRQKGAVVPWFHCPSRRAAIGYPPDEASYNAVTPTHVAKVDYAGNCGSFRVGWNAGPGYECLNTYPNCGSLGFVDSRVDGLTYRRSEVQVAAVENHDGTSRTIFCGEKYMNPKHYNVGTSCSDNNSAYQGYDWDVNRWTSNDAACKPAQDNPGFEDGCSNRFGSAHPSGFHVCMGDGTVHLLNFNIDQAVFSHLGSRNDGSSDSDKYLH